MRAEPILKIANSLGEGPLWHSIHQMLYWVDIEKKEVHGLELHTNRHRAWPVGKRVGTAVAAANGNLILGLQGEIAELDPTTETINTLLQLEPHLPDNRCNDGKCDAAGRFWVGTMHRDCKPGMGSLYCIDPDLKIHTLLSGLTIANGLGWSPTGDHMYFIDSAERQVRRYAFRKEYIALEKEEIILSFENKKELPDGMCVDSEGKLWIGFWGGSRVGRYDPDTGKLLEDIQVAAPHVTSCCFGGRALQTLYITTAREGLTPEQLDEFPLSGSLFACDTNTKGLDSNFFGQQA